MKSKKYRVKIAFEKMIAKNFEKHYGDKRPWPEGTDNPEAINTFLFEGVRVS